MFSGVGYTEAHILIPGLLLVALALVVGAAIAVYNAIGPRRLVTLLAAVAPAVVVYVGLTVVSWYVGGFIVKPNQLVRERPYIAPQHRVHATGRSTCRACSRRPSRPTPGIAAVDLATQRRDARQHPALGLAGAAGHAAADPGDPDLLRLPRHRHRPLPRSAGGCGR